MGYAGNETAATLVGDLDQGRIDAIGTGAGHQAYVKRAGR
jgi:hypothetical protein